MPDPSDNAPAAIPADDHRRTLTVANSDSADLRHISIGGGTYTVLVDGTQSAGRYCLIDMFVPPDSGPPPHRHDFEEMFTLLEGELAFTIPGRDDDGRRRFHPEYPGQRAALLQERVEPAGKNAVHVHTCRDRMRISSKWATWSMAVRHLRRRSGQTRLRPGARRPRHLPPNTGPSS